MKKPDPGQKPAGEASGQKDDDDVAYPIPKPKKTGYQMEKDEESKKKVADTEAYWEYRVAHPEEFEDEEEEE